MAKLYCKWGTMGAGKSDRLIEVAESYERQGKSVLTLTSDGSGSVSSRSGRKRDAITISESTNLLRLVQEDDYRIILVDEAQFLSPTKIKEIWDIVHEFNIPAMAFGLKDDFRKEMFLGSATLFALAESIEEIRAICANCEKKATCNIRIVDGMPVLEGPQVLIGREESYRAVCSGCYKEAFKKENILQKK